ncbi:CocE/NonD family hydrolase [Granulicella tundricola]|uniref:Hydrolase CocE/NonD family protein n=1 Tax=Granulicella tundricola (strain ATCC BAA-1859 / DSM 23138 / MP5ACTX9) TaxID=1198114 RepID=E8X5G8_GRATM|nr:CocE/NonD family hydrolase [Granulicella tundricola]ADW69515.1 hydrolase CocE/NonD family protein [Granulicella tundricola MP5ACTX9]
MTVRVASVAGWLSLVAVSSFSIAQAPAKPSLQSYVGLYKVSADAGGTLSIYMDGAHLYEETEHDPKHELTLGAGVDSLQVEDAPLKMVFARDGKGNVTSFKAVRTDNSSTLFSGTRMSQEATRLNLPVGYEKIGVMIPMRDGVKLHAVVIKPKDSSTAVPFLMQRTPYGVDHYSVDSVYKSKPELAASGYIFVFEDIRGRYGSEGQFVMNRPIVNHVNKTDVDETTDTRDTIDWLLKNESGNNGAVGVYGVSYPGFLAMMAGIDAHPAVKAISPQAPMTDVWMGDDFFHNGAFRQTYGFDYVQQLEAQKTDARVESKGDTYDYFLKHVNFAGAAKDAGMEKLPTAVKFLNEPSYTKFWKDMGVEYHLTKVEVPTLEVGGYWDQEDMWGTQEEYAKLHAQDKDHKVFMVLGPWNHGGWGGPGNELGGNFGKLEFGEPTGDEYRKTIEAPFFEKYLKGKDGYDLMGVASFRTGINKWERYEAWPPPSGFKPAKVFLQADGGLATDAPQAPKDDAAAAKKKGLMDKIPFKKPSAPPIPKPGAPAKQMVVGTYVADPANPIPYRNRPIQATYGDGSKWRTWLVEDQKFVDARKDVAEFQGAPLAQDFTVTGDVMADLFASTTGTDADWIVKLIDVSPEGVQTMIVDEIFRGRYKESFETAHAIPANKVVEYKWSLHGADHTFLKGHRIMVEVQSSWFPLYDRNPQTFVANIMSAPAEAYQKQTVKIMSGSHLEFLTTE